MGERELAGCSARSEEPDERGSDLAADGLLEGKAMRAGVDQPGDRAEADEPIARQVEHGGVAPRRQEMVRAHGANPQSAHRDQTLRSRGGRERLGREEGLDVHLVAVDQVVRPRIRDPLRGFPELGIGTGILPNARRKASIAWAAAERSTAMFPV